MALWGKLELLPVGASGPPSTSPEDGFSGGPGSAGLMVGLCDLK